MTDHPGTQSFHAKAGMLVILAAAVLFSLTPRAYAEEDLSPLLKGLTREEVLSMGEIMYRTGVLPNGKAMQAMVKGDVPVEGTMFTCVTCHLRSGFGTGEGTVRTPPIDGTRLYSSVSAVRGAPVVGMQREAAVTDLLRPAYTDATLAKVLETGIDPAGRQLNTAMPIYFLGDRDKAILVTYLKNLSTGQQPGVTGTTLRFATVITEDVPKEYREAMLQPLQNFIHNWRLPASMDRGMRSSLYRREGAMKTMRTMSLSVWELKGPSETWRKQLEDQYRKEPVFALLGGITTREWAPVHRFCEDHKIPAIFPVTDFPEISETDWYTLYPSRGLAQEGETAARFLNNREGLQKDLSVVQVIGDEPAGHALSKAFRDTWTGLGREAPETIMLKSDESPPPFLWKTLGKKSGQTVVLLWLSASAFPDLKLLAQEHEHPTLVFASSSMLGQRLYSLPESERGYLYVTYPHILPQDSKRPRVQAEIPQTANAVPKTAQDATLIMQSLFQILPDPLSRMRSFVYRDYFIEAIESLPDLVARPAIYPRLSFGSGQRYASKGCYIVQLGEGPEPGLIARSEWVIH